MTRSTASAASLTMSPSFTLGARDALTGSMDVVLAFYRQRRKTLMSEFFSSIINFNLQDIKQNMFSYVVVANILMTNSNFQVCLSQVRPPLKAELPKPEEVEQGRPRVDQEDLQGDQAEQAQSAVHGAC